jgi:hypothetical protein
MVTSTKAQGRSKHEANLHFGDRDLESRDASHRNVEMRIAKAPSEQACGHRLRPHVKGKVKGAKGIRLKRFTL